MNDIMNTVTRGRQNSTRKEFRIIETQCNIPITNS